MRRRAATSTARCEARPNDPGVRYQVANVDLATGNADQARKALEALIGESPDFAEAHASLATVYYRLDRRADGDRERALAQKLMDQRDAADTGATGQMRRWLVLCRAAGCC